MVGWPDGRMAAWSDCRMGRRSDGRFGKKLSDEELAKPLKQHCGVGGTVKGFDIEIQGEDRAKIQKWLEGRGFKVKFAGG